MKNNIMRMIALGLFTAVVLAMPGCSENNNQTTSTTQETVAVSEIDSFAMSVDMVKTHYDKNEMYLGQVDEAANQAMIMEAFLDEIPNLYQDAEYKNKIINIYNVLEGIDTAKSGLVKEDGCDSSFNRLKQVTTRIYNKFQ